MMQIDSDFTIKKVLDDNANPFARQEAIDGWDQDLLRRAKVLVVGAGAIGNEVLKNLALLGVGNIYIVDRDTIEVSNLSRSLLFSVDDSGKTKAEVAAAKTQQLCLEPDACVNFFHGDVVHHLGLGVFRRMDLVLGTLDNIEARVAVGRGCWAFGKPWVDGSIAGYAGNIAVYGPPHTACYLCTLGRNDYASLRQIYSCDNRKRRVLGERKIPAVQTVSAMVAAAQVHEGLKILSGSRPDRLKIITFDTHWNFYSVTFQEPVNDHEMHFGQLDMNELALLHNCGHKSTIAELERASRSYLGGSSVVYLQLEDPFVTHATCRKCGHSEGVNRPLSTIHPDEYATCPICRASNPEEVLSEADLTVRLENVTRIPLDSVLPWRDYTLQDLGIPALQVIRIEDEVGRGKYFELTADEDIVFEQVGIL